MNIFHLKTNQIQLFKKLIEALREIMIETNMELSNNCLKIIKMNSKNSIFCSLTLEKDKINNDANFFECQYPENKPLFVGVNLLNLSKILKSVSTENILHFQIEKNNKNALIVKVENTDRLELSNYTINFIEINL